MKNLILLFLVMTSMTSFPQKSYYKYKSRDDNNSEKYERTTLAVEVSERTFEISLSGKLKSYTSLFGDEVKRDFSDRIVKVGEVEISYGYSNKVKSIGNIEIHYDYQNRIDKIGDYEVLYDYSGNFKGTRKVQKPTRYWY